MNGFDLILQKMGISENAKSYFKIDTNFQKTIWENPKIKEVEISADDKDLIWTDDGIYYQGKKIILYIRDVMKFSNYEPQEPKFHIVWCQTLQRMHSQGKYEKYVVSIDTEKTFKINYINKNKTVETVEKELHVCKHCLRALNWKNYNNVSPTQKKQIYENFSIEEFFNFKGSNEKDFPFTPAHTDMTAPINKYPDDWKNISESLRSEAEFVCSSCGKKILDTKNLHVHHKNSLKNDNSRANLEVLCADCHQKKHNHKIFGSSRDKDNSINLVLNFS